MDSYRTTAEKTEDQIIGIGKMLAKRAVREKLGIDRLIAQYRGPVLIGFASFIILAVLLSSLPLTLIGVGDAVTDTGSFTETWNELSGDVSSLIESEYKKAYTDAKKNADKKLTECIEENGDNSEACTLNVDIQITMGGSPAEDSIVVSAMEANRLLAVYGIISRYGDETGTYGDLANTVWESVKDQEDGDYDSFLKQVRSYVSGLYEAGGTVVSVAREETEENEKPVYTGRIYCEVVMHEKDFMTSEKNEAVSRLAETEGITEEEAADLIDRETEDMLNSLNAEVGADSVSVNREELFTSVTENPLYSLYSSKFVTLSPPFSLEDVTSQFGPRTLRGKPNFHGGMDFGEARHTPVNIPADGLVVFTYDGCLVDNDETLGYGNYVIVYHGRKNGLDIYTLYGHLHTVDVKEGQQITAGQQIGTVGSRGNSTGPHLHWEVNTFNPETGEACKVNPEKYID